MEILYDVSLRDPLAFKHLSEVSAQDCYQFASQVVRQAVRFVEWDVHSGHLPMASDEYRLATPE
jgi:hypothetical protein